MRSAIRISAGLLAAWSAGAHAAIPTFDGDSAQARVVALCAHGPRVPGSLAHRTVLSEMKGRLEELGLETLVQAFPALNPITGDTIQATNLLASVRPGTGPRLMIGAHWDSRPMADQDADPSRRRQAVLGANDGASGTAVLLELAEILVDHPPPIGVDLAFFDAEDMGRVDHPEEFCLGSQWMASHWAGPLPDWMLLLDMVGSESAEFGVEIYGAEANPEWSDLVFRVAERLGFGEWNRGREYAVVDDHLPFLRLGVPAVDMIGWGDPRWHTSHDTPLHTSPETLRRVGQVVIELIYGGDLAHP